MPGDTEGSQQASRRQPHNPPLTVVDGHGDSHEDEKSPNKPRHDVRLRVLREELPDREWKCDDDLEGGGWGAQWNAATHHTNCEDTRV